MFKKIVDFFENAEEAVKPVILAQLKELAEATEDVLLAYLHQKLSSAIPAAKNGAVA